MSLHYKEVKDTGFGFLDFSQSSQLHELLISAGITAIGMLVLTMLYKITIRVKEYSESGLQ